MKLKLRDVFSFLGFSCLGVVLCLAGSRSAWATADPAPGSPNILLIVTEDHGPNFNCYQDQTVPTPNVNKLAAEGVLFRNAYVTQAVCSPSRGSILTGLYPHQNGQIGLQSHNFTMTRAWPTIPSLLKNAGYRTGIIGKLHVNPASAFPFDYEFHDPNVVSFGKRDVVKTAAAAGTFMAADKKPFFLMVNYPDAHLPFVRQDLAGIPQRPVTPDDVSTPAGALVDTARLRTHAANYYNCIRRIDTAIGLLLAELEKTGKSKSTLVIWISDHGAQFARGKVTSYEFATQIPCIVRYPGNMQAGQVRAELVSTIDLLPTIIEAAQIQAPENLPGRSLVPLLRGESPEWREFLFTEWNTSHAFPAPSLYFPQRTVRDKHYKLIANLMSGVPNPAELYYTSQALITTGATQSEIDAADAETRAAFQTWRDAPPFELYDLEKDPLEKQNLAGQLEWRDTQQRLETALRQWRVDTHDPLLNPSNLERLAEEHVASATHKQKQETSRTPYVWKYPAYFSE